MPLQPTDSIGQALIQATDRLAALPDCEPRLEAEILLAHLLQKPRSHLYAWPDKTLSKRQQQDLMALLDQRLAGQPMAYLTGVREFWSLSLRVSPATLIPRADTEWLVERALQLLPGNNAWQIADLGTGSGAIAAAIAHERPRCRILASDIDPQALEVARQNFQQLGLSNVRCHQGSWCEALPRDVTFDLIVANPPYIASDDPHLQLHGLSWEPRSALVSGPEGLDDIRRIAAQTSDHLKVGGWLLLEHGFDQSPAVRRIFRKAGFLHVQTSQDLSGNDRVTAGSKSTGVHSRSYC